MSSIDTFEPVSMPPKSTLSQPLHPMRSSFSGLTPHDQPQRYYQGGCLSGHSAPRPLLLHPPDSRSQSRRHWAAWVAGGAQVGSAPPPPSQTSPSCSRTAAVYTLEQYNASSYGTGHFVVATLLKETDAVKFNDTYLTKCTPNITSMYNIK